MYFSNKYVSVGQINFITRKICSYHFQSKIFYHITWGNSSKQIRLPKEKIGVLLGDTYLSTQITCKPLFLVYHCNIFCITADYFYIINTLIKSFANCYFGTDILFINRLHQSPNMIQNNYP